MSLTKVNNGVIVDNLEEIFERTVYRIVNTESWCKHFSVSNTTVDGVNT